MAGGKKRNGGKGKATNNKKQRQDEQPADEQKQIELPAVPQPPISRLYRDALQSVLGFCGLADLSRALCVSRSWSERIRSMKSIGASIDRPALLPLLLGVSGLATHVVSLGGQPVRTTFDCSGLFILSPRLTSLKSLIGQIAMPQPLALCLPSQLTSLNLKFTGDAAAVASINTAIVTISRLPSLQDLTLVLPSLFPALNFSPLASASPLHSLWLDPADASQPTAEQMDQLRTLRSLYTMKVHGLSSRSLEHLLRTPHDLAWQVISDFNSLEAGGIAALASLPRLHSLRVRSCPTVNFLPSIKKLRHLNLLFFEPWPVPAAAIVEAVSQCSQLCSLGLGAPVASKHVNDILAHLPLMVELVLNTCSELESLAFLSEPKPIPCKLQWLTLSNCRNPALHSTELKRLSSVASLTSLQIYRSFVEPLDGLMQWMLKPPSPMFPKLKTFTYAAP